MWIKNFVNYRNQLVTILNQESSLMEIVKLIGSDVLPDDQKSSRSPRLSVSVSFSRTLSIRKIPAFR